MKIEVIEINDYILYKLTTEYTRNIYTRWTSASIMIMRGSDMSKTAHDPKAIISILS